MRGIRVLSLLLGECITPTRGILPSLDLKLIRCRLLWAFDILPDLDSQGKEVLPSLNENEGTLIARPAPFAYRLVLRDADMGSVIERESESAKQQLKAWD